MLSWLQMGVEQLLLTLTQPGLYAGAEEIGKGFLTDLELMPGS